MSVRLMSAPFQFTPQTPRPYPQPPPLPPQWFTAQHQQHQHPQRRHQPRFDPNSFSAATTPSHPRPPPRPPTPYARNPQLPDAPYPPPAAPSYQPYSSYSPWVPVIPPDYDSDSTDKDPDSPLSGPPGPNNLQPRPHYWRSHYPNKRVQCPLTRFFSSQDSQHIRLNPLLHYKSKKDPPMRYDLCVLPSQDHQFTLPAFHRRPSPRDMRQFATDPPVQHIRLWHHLLPSYIDITTTNRYDDDEGDGAITIGDLLEQLHSDLRRRISLYDYWTTALTSKKREQLDNTCNYRVSVTGPAGDRAICHIDFLDREFLFVGMIPCSNGTFEFKTIPVL